MLNSLKGYILNLEKTGKYVFHGSPINNLKFLEPKQAKHVPNLSNSNEVLLDGNPAVSATPYIDFAIFRAIINKTNIPISFTSGFGFKNVEKEFHISSQEVLEIAKTKKGFIYVFNKNEFEPYQRDQGINLTKMEWRAYKKVKPLEIIEVSYEDLINIKKIDILN